MKVQKFIKKLREILDSENKDIINWGKDNCSFEIYDIAKFEADILPKYYKSVKFKSFQRQLNYFNFKKLTKSQTDICTFKNLNFKRFNTNYLQYLNKNYDYDHQGLRDSKVKF